MQLIITFVCNNIILFQIIIIGLRKRFIYKIRLQYTSNATPGVFCQVYLILLHVYMLFIPISKSDFRPHGFLWANHKKTKQNICNIYFLSILVIQSLPVFVQFQEHLTACNDQRKCSIEFYKSNRLTSKLCKQLVLPGYQDSLSMLTFKIQIKILRTLRILKYVHFQ